MCFKTHPPIPAIPKESPIYGIPAAVRLQDAPGGFSASKITVPYLLVSPVYFKKITVTPDDERAWFRKHPQWSKSNRYAELEVWIFI
ncbi:hypothetical protein FMM75_18940 [Lachnospiraceae bacterium MD335]|nr:hypothetical protein [Lachnospiraceae bacterium MD335]